jgi:hypothetical protein
LDGVECAGDDIPIERANIGLNDIKAKVWRSQICGLKRVVLGKPVISVGIPQTEKRIRVRRVTIDQCLLDLVFLTVTHFDTKNSSAWLHVGTRFDETIKMYHNFSALGDYVLTDAHLIRIGIM